MASGEIEEKERILSQQRMFPIIQQIIKHIIIIIKGMFVSSGGIIMRQKRTELKGKPNWSPQNQWGGERVRSKAGE